VLKEENKLKIGLKQLKGSTRLNPLKK